MTTITPTTCPYCGVGCGVLAEVDPAGNVAIRGDQAHPANLGRLCSKGSALAETLGMDGRLLYPEIDGERSGWGAAIRLVADGFASVIDRHGPDAVAFYVSGQLLTEDYYVANKLMKGFIGSANIDTNSRLCMASSVAGHRRAFGSDTVPCCYDDLERAKLIVLVGSNTAWCHPVLYQRMVEAKRINPDLMIVVIDPRRTATCDAADLHLPVRSGTDAWLFNGLLWFLAHIGERNDLFLDRCAEGVEQALDAARLSAPDVETVAAICGLPATDVERFYRLFARTERTITVYSQGVNQSSAGTDKVNAIINCHLFTGRIGRPGMGPFSFTGQPNAMGGREVGGLANQLAAHMEIENPRHRTLVQQFWDSPVIAAQVGLKAVEMFQAIDAGKVKAVWVMATNPVVSMPEADLVRRALAKAELVVVSDCIKSTDTNIHAHVRLPALAWGEKDGTVTNSERRISRQRAFLPPPGEARADWRIICDVARAMGFEKGFDYEYPDEIFREHAALSGVENNGSRDFDISALRTLSRAEYDALKPVQWPVMNGEGRARMFGDGRFFTPNGRARLLPIQPRSPACMPDADYPFLLNTGRVRDHWHTMTRTARAPRLNRHTMEPFVAIHPDEALSLGVKDDDLVRVASRHGEVILRVAVDDGQRHGDVFIPMHWNDQYSAQARVDTLVAPATDPISGQPELKHTPVRLTPYRPVWQAVILLRRPLEVIDAPYWTLIPAAGVLRYEIAGDSIPSQWSKWAVELLGAETGDDWIEYHDGRSMRYRAALLENQRLIGCIFIGPDANVVDREWLAGLAAKTELSNSDRLSLLAGRPLEPVASAGRIVCACFGVGENVIREAIQVHGCKTVEDITRCTKAGGNCGACKPELKKFL